MRLYASVLGVIGLAAIITSASPASSAVITVLNPSFEILPAGGLPFGCGTGCNFSADAIPDWSGAGSIGQFQPGPPATITYFNSVPDGITVAYSNGGFISQTVTPTAQAGVTYTLLVDVGFRHDLPDPGTVALLFGGNAPVFATGIPNQGSGDWATYTASYTATAADTGKSISITLASDSAQGDWDNVRLSSSVPEASTWAMMLIGFAGIGFFAYRRTKKTFAAIATA